MPLVSNTLITNVIEFYLQAHWFKVPTRGGTLVVQANRYEEKVRAGLR